MNGAMLWGRFSLCMKKEMMSSKEGNVICLLEKESRDDEGGFSSVLGQSIF